MKVQILNSFKGDDVRDIDTSSAEGRGSAAKLIADLLRTGSALFLERTVNGKTYTYRVSGYDAERDKIKLVLAPSDLPIEEEAVEEAGTRRRGRPRGSRNLRNRVVSAASDAGQIVSVAPVSGGSGRLKGARKKRREEEWNKTAPSWEAVRWAMSQMCEQRGWHHGCPLPSSTDTAHQLVIAKGAPLADTLGTAVPVSFAQPQTRVCRTKDVQEVPEQRVNSWMPTPVRVDLWRDGKGVFKLQWPMAHVRLKFWLDSITVRAGAVDAASEVTAMVSLRDKVTKGQFDSYILSGAFPETSTRSGVTYILRKGLPTIAMTERPRGDGSHQRNFLAALCLHPMAYYHQTWVGSQPPTDEVIAHLMMIRADEHRFWKKSGQHGITDPRAAI